MVPLEDPQARADLCLDCHFGSAKRGQFVTHTMMAAGHPRISFELDLFTALQRHHDEDADYATRKRIAGGVKMWAVGQSMALYRALALYSDGVHGKEGSFPEFYFYDCQSCHRAIYDDPSRPPAAQVNPGRPTPPGTPPFNDENIIMLLAAVHVAAPNLANRFEEQSRQFHAALARDGGQALAAAAQLAQTARALASAFAAATFDKPDTLSILSGVVSKPLADRYTDYEGAAQAVMAVDTLLNALVTAQQIEPAKAKTLRPQIAELYRIVHDPNAYRRADFQAALARVAAAVRSIS